MGQPTDEQRLEAENTQLKALVDRLRTEAQIHAQEARTANATIYDIYQVVSGGTGELGNWHGVEPVREALERLKVDLAQAREREARLRVLLRAAVQCFCVTQQPDDYPVDSWINKALAELRRPDEAGT
jgi:hypothetical protein